MSGQGDMSAPEIWHTARLARAALTLMCFADLLRPKDRLTWGAERASSRGASGSLRPLKVMSVELRYARAPGSSIRPRRAACGASPTPSPLDRGEGPERKC
jgi:hypothetical protein